MAMVVAQKNMKRQDGGVGALDASAPFQMAALHGLVPQPYIR
jgi:hypothetical protein